MNRLRATLIILGLCVVMVKTDVVLAGWPERQVKVVVTFPPGSANDTAARLFSERLALKWGKPVVVENRAGAEGTIGVGAFVAEGDDHTLLYTVGGSVSVAPLMVEKVHYDPDRDLIPIASTTAIVLTLSVNEAAGIDSMPKLVQIAKAQPDKLVWASGPGLLRYAFEAFLKRRGLSMTYVAYRDAAQPQADLREGRIQVLVTSLGASVAPVQAGKAHFLAVLNASRTTILPDVSTVRELGYEELEIDGIAGFFGGRKMPSELRDRIAAEVADVCADPEVRRRLEGAGHIVLSGQTRELTAAIERQRKWFSDINQLVPVKEPK